MRILVVRCVRLKLLAARMERDIKRTGAWLKERAAAWMLSSVAWLMRTASVWVGTEWKHHLMHRHQRVVGELWPLCRHVRLPVAWYEIKLRRACISSLPLLQPVNHKSSKTFQRAILKAFISQIIRVQPPDCTTVQSLSDMFDSSFNRRFELLPHSWLYLKTSNVHIFNHCATACPTDH